MRTFNFAAVIEKDEDGYFAICPGLQGCASQGDTYEEAFANIRDAIQLHVEDRLASGEEIKTADSIHLTSIGIAI